MECYGEFFGGLGLLVCFAVLHFRIYKYKSSTEHRSWIFKIYLALNGLLGTLLMVLGAVDIPNLYAICIALWMFAWNLISVLATFAAPVRWSIVPMSYVCMCTLLCLYSVATRPVTPAISTLHSSNSVRRNTVNRSNLCTPYSHIYEAARRIKRLIRFFFKFRPVTQRLQQLKAAPRRIFIG